MTVTGRCFCGAVRYRAARAPVDVDTCYCADCARAVGSTVTTWARFPADDFSFTAGKPVRFESSPGVFRTFCPRCGSALTYHYPNGKDIDVATGTLDDPAAFPPRTDGPRRPPWIDEITPREKAKRKPRRRA